MGTTAIWWRLGGCDALTVTAMCLTVSGCALIWAHGLPIIGCVPLPLALIAFFLGLMLIPFRSVARLLRSPKLLRIVVASIVFLGGAANAQNCPVSHVKASVKPSGGPSNGGLDNNEWAAVVNRDGTVCAVRFTG